MKQLTAISLITFRPLPVSSSISLVLKALYDKPFCVDYTNKHDHGNICIGNPIRCKTERSVYLCRHPGSCNIISISMQSCEMNLLEIHAATAVDTLNTMRLGTATCKWMHFTI